MPEQVVTEHAVLTQYPRMGLEDCFQFQCRPGMDCFTSCCRDVSIVLTPYDILRLKRALKMDSSEFLEKYTISPFAAGQKIPVRMLKMEGEVKQCPFVSEAGCGVYGHRPWACRMYPLGVAEPRQTTPDDRTFHFLLREDICHGHGEGKVFSVAKWISDQGIEEYEAMGVGFKQLMLDPFWDKAEALSPAQVEMFHMACYDLDRFRRFVFESKFLQYFVVDEARVEALRHDDLELLDFAMQWLRFTLFHERSMKIRPEVLEAKKRNG